jgi:hypothetical protein
MRSIFAHLGIIRSWKTSVVEMALNKLQALVSAPGMSRALAKETRENNAILNKLQARAVDHYLGSSETLVLVHDVESFILKARAGQLLGFFAAEWDIHPWRVNPATVSRGMNQTRLAKLCAKAMNMVGTSSNVNGVVWTVAERDPWCRVELLRLGHSSTSGNPLAKAFIRNLEQFHVLQECSCVGLKVSGNQVAWVRGPIFDSDL